MRSVIFMSVLFICGAFSDMHIEDKEVIRGIALLFWIFLVGDTIELVSRFVTKSKKK